VALATAGAALCLGTACFVTAVILPALRTRRVVEKYGKYCEEQAIKDLGGARAAIRQIRLYVHLPDWVAPGKTHAVGLLEECGADGIPLLLDLLEDAEPARRADAAGVLARMYYRPPGRFGGGPPTPRELLQRKVFAALEPHLQDPDERARVQAAWAVCGMQEEWDSVLPVFMALLGTGDEEVAQTAKWGLVHIGREAVFPLTDAVLDGEVSRRRAAAHALYALVMRRWERDYSRRPLDWDWLVDGLGDALCDPDVEVRRTAASALRRTRRLPWLAGEDLAIRVAYARLDEDARVRADAEEIIYDIGSQSIPALVGILEGNEDLVAFPLEVKVHRPTMRRSALELLEGVLSRCNVLSDNIDPRHDLRVARSDRLTALGRRAVDALGEMLGDEDAAARARAARLLGTIAESSGVDVASLNRAAADRDPRVRSAACDALERIQRDALLSHRPW
jgi:HEAT repeat protein